MPRTRLKASRDAEPRAIRRIVTPLFGFNQAIGGGIPVRTRMEISGASHSGKSTLSYYLAGVVSRPKGRIVLCDFETEDDRYPMANAERAGWGGTFYSVPVISEKGTPMSDDDMLDWSIQYFAEKPDSTALIVDSIGAIFTNAEVEGSVSDANMGKRAQVVKRFNGKLAYTQRNGQTDSVAFLINHTHDAMGGKMGTITSGGKSMEYSPALRIRLWANREDEQWTLNGTVFKRRYIDDPSLPNTFQVIVVPGVGVHAGITAVNDCVLAGLAESDRVVKLGGKSYGTYKEMRSKIDDEEFFEPFVESLRRGEAVVGKATNGKAKRTRSKTKPH